MSLFQYGRLTSHSGLQLRWKLECDHWTDEDLEGMAHLLLETLTFGPAIVAVPSDERPPRNPAGPRLARILRGLPAPRADGPPLVLDDVLTTGASMEETRAAVMRNRTGACVGFVILARGPCPDWVHPLMTVGRIFQ